MLACNAVCWSMLRDVRVTATRTISIGCALR
jgi:hypothetical protein